MDWNTIDIILLYISGAFFSTGLAFLNFARKKEKELKNRA